MRKKRVIDTSKVLRILEELEEQTLFKLIIKSKDVTLDNECPIKNRALRTMNSKMNNKTKLKLNKSDFEELEVPESNFDMIKDSIDLDNIDINSKLNSINVKKNYEAMGEYYEEKNK